VIIKHINQQAVSPGTGNPSIEHDLPEGWIRFTEYPECQQRLNALAVNLDKLLRARLPEDTLKGLLKGREREIQQDAHLLLLSRFLSGNRKLLQATRTGTHSEILNQVQRSISAAVNINMRRLRRMLSQESNRWVPLPEDAGSFGRYDHVSNRGYWELPYPIQRELALLMIRRALQQARITRGSAMLATTMIEQNLTQAEMARQLRVSRSAVNQRLASVRECLRADLAPEEPFALDDHSDNRTGSVIGRSHLPA